MAWIESHQSLSRHRKTLTAAALLKTDRHKVIGHLHELWWWGLDNADIHGNLGLVPDDMIAEGAGWPVKEASRFVDALVSARFLERKSDGSVILHDWYDFAGKLNERRAKDAARKRMSEDYPPETPDDRPRNGHGNPADIQRNSAGTSIGASEGNPADIHTGSVCTVPNQPNQPIKSSVSDPRIDEVYEHFKAKVQPKSRICPRKKIASRLKRWSVAELIEGIDRFAAAPWWMEHNASRGGEWFFESDARSEQFLLLEPERPIALARNGSYRPPESPSPPRQYIDVSGFQGLNIKGRGTA